MQSPFPGMDPYLEAPGLWPNVHTSLIVALRDDLALRLRPRYFVSVEERVVQLGADDVMFAVRPDAAIIRAQHQPALLPSILAADQASVITVELPLPEESREVYLEIRSTTTEQVVTVIEVLSPVNKQPGRGRHEYEQKRLSLLGTLTHLVEIDLLRAGDPMPMRGYAGLSDYRLLVSRSELRPHAELLPFSIRQAIPSFRLPLAAGDAEPDVELGRLFQELYDRAGYDLRINYSVEPVPPLRGDDTAWADALLRAAGQR